jgi:hypothetical protein
MTKPHPMRNASLSVKCPRLAYPGAQWPPHQIHWAHNSRGCKWCSPWGQFCAHGKQFLRGFKIWVVSCTSTMCKRIIPSTSWWGGPVAIRHIMRCFLADWCLAKRVPSIKYDATTTSNPTSISKRWHSGTILIRRIWWRLDTCWHQLLHVERSCK